MHALTSSPSARFFMRWRRVEKHSRSTASVIAAILEHDLPAFADSAGQTDIERVIRKCLAKDPDDRWQTASDLLTVLEWVADGSLQPPDRATARMPARTRIIYASAAAMSIALLVLVAVVFAMREAPPPPVRTIRFTVPAPEKSVLMPAGRRSRPTDRCWLLSPPRKDGR